MIDLHLIDTIVVVMMENRSFDHLLGYLSLEGYPVNGLRSDADWLTKMANPYADGYLYRPFEYVPDRLPADPPHEREDITGQIGIERGYDLKGFVTSYARVHPIGPNNPPAVMGYCLKAQLPVIDSLVRSYAVCDRWFAPLPAGTQPNRLMAASGFSLIDRNVHVLPSQEIVYDWLNNHGVRWRVYHEGTPFFALMPNWIDEILLTGHFCPLRNLAHDVQNDGDDMWPQVIFIEPKYSDDPTRIGDASDHHPPSSLQRGQEFIGSLYVYLTSNPRRWARTVMIITYDEHGGFFDHVVPEPVSTSGKGRYQDFSSTGIRVPALVISPLIEARTVFSNRLDHTSILKFIGQRFAADGYSPEVNARAVGSVADVLNRTSPRNDIPKLPVVQNDPSTMTVNMLAFQKATTTMVTKHPDKTRSKLPQVWHAQS